MIWGPLSLFAGLEPAELEQLASWFDVEERDAGASLTRQGASGYAFFVLRKGTATVIQDDEEIRQLGPGDFFGELSIIGDGHRTATVKTNVARHRLEHVRNAVPEPGAAVPRIGREDSNRLCLGTLARAG